MQTAPILVCPQWLNKARSQKLWREWAPVVPVSREEGACGGRFEHRASNRQPGNHDVWCNWKLLRPWLSGGILQPRDAGKEICSVGTPSVREGEFVDIEVDSGSEVSRLSASIGADTYPLHENEAQNVWRSRCSGWRQTAWVRCQDSGVGKW